MNFIVTIFISIFIQYTGVGEGSYFTESSIVGSSPLLNNPTKTLKTNDMKSIKLSNSELSVKVDDEDYSFLNRFKWIYNGGYVVRSNDKMKMHTLIMGAEKKAKMIDHIDRDVLNNQKNNLRFATATQNSVNRKPKKSGFYKGVIYLPEYRKRKTKEGRLYHSKVDKRYRAALKHNNITYSLGCFYTPEEAAHAYDKKAYELHGDYAYLNIPHLIKTN